MEEFKGDKRTKAYKDYLAKKEAESEGLGDTVKKVFETVGVDKVVKFLAGEDCGCDERADKLNKIYPYKKLECFTEEEFNFVSDLKERKPSILTKAEVTMIYNTKNRVFGTKDIPSNCTLCVKDRINQLITILKAY